MMTPIRAKIFLVIMAIVTAITLSSMVISIVMSRRQVFSTVEKDMRLVASLADQLLSKEISLLKANAAIAAQKLLVIPEEQLPLALGEQVEAYDEFLAMTVFDASGQIAASYGEFPAPADLADTKYGRRGYAGERIISTTIRDPAGLLVFHLVVPMEGRLLAVAISGMFFADFLAPLKIWETGHIFVDDEEGTVIANPRRDWISGRVNFIELAKTNSRFEPTARIVRRMIRGESGIGRFAIEGKERICVFMPISGSLAGWSLGVIAPLAESPSAQMRPFFFIVGLLFFGMGLAAAFFASASVAKPFLYIQEQNIRLEELSKAAQSASEAKSRFLANMSHEMRTPLNAIIGLSELTLNKGDLATPVEENLEKVYSSGITLLGIVNDLLDISKIESGKFELIPGEYDLPSLINDTITLNIVRVGSKPIVFKLLIDETLPSRLIGDELRLKQIFNNLLSNAFKYTKEGTVEWRIFCQEEQGEVWLNTVVKDSGEGIKAEDMGRLFSDYNRLDTKKNRNLEGTGLGLALTKRMVELMGGVITVESEYGKGSAFTARLRQKSTNAPPIGTRVAENLRDSRYTIQKRNRHAGLERVLLPYAKVLVVDDVSINLDVAQGMMQPYGMQVDCAQGGREAVELVQKGEPRYDAIFMDHMMPDLDGIEAVRIIREEIGTEYAKNVPIIVLTANAIEGNEEMFIKHGFQDFLSKPIDILRMDAVIHRWVRDKAKET